MKNKIKKALLATLALTTLSFTACGKKAAEEPATPAPTVTSNGEETAPASDLAGSTITVAANITPHSEILYEAQAILANEGITLEVVELEDSVTPNTAVIEGSADANYFQHVPYLEDFNSQNGSDLVSIGAIHYEPFAIYSANLDSLADLPDNATIAVPNNVTNEARALLLLEQEGVLTLNEDAGIAAAITDIVDNPKNITFLELDPSQLANALPDVDAAVINGNYALEGGLSISDALAKEASDSLAAQTYGNIIATTSANADNPALKRLVEVLKSDEIKQFINDNYEGAVVPLD